MVRIICDSEEAQFIRANRMRREVIAVIKKPSGFFTRMIISYLSHGTGGLYDEGRGTRLVEHSFKGEVLQKFLQWLHSVCGQRKIKLDDLMTGFKVRLLHETSAELESQLEEYIRQFRNQYIALRPRLRIIRE